jgi:hypothetical protein
VLIPSTFGLVVLGCPLALLLPEHAASRSASTTAHATPVVAELVRKGRLRSRTGDIFAFARR